MTPTLTTLKLNNWKAPRLRSSYQNCLAEITELQQTLVGISTSVAALTTRLPLLAKKEVELQNSECSATPDPDPLRSAEEPHSWLERTTEGRPLEVYPAVLDFLQAHWGFEGRSEQFRAALTSFPRLQLPFTMVPELNPEMKALAKEGSRRHEGDSEGPTNVTAQDQALKGGQDAMAAAMGPLVGLLQISLSEEVIDKRMVADHGDWGDSLRRSLASARRGDRTGRPRPPPDGSP
ncbi:hypothetical protein HPB47_009749 [Ixodes persulcatus]|uniref:Uncharacterized protein n=1 Tax=Ixodes persulcatus TaxID=34615 RepID=A0AC60P102_IXOPE|nr:hypothetical protein HPB47_009749 [Ixodes persulcatus]